jgi:hypothetical protein
MDLLPSLKLPKRIKYILIGGGVVILLGFAYRTVPLLGSMSPSEETILKERQVASYRKVLQEKTKLEGRFSSLKQTVEQLESGVFVGETPSLAAADIQKIVDEITKRSDVSIKEVRVLKPEQSSFENYLSIPVEFSFNCSIRQLKEILYHLDTSAKYLTVSKSQLNRIGGSQNDQIQAYLTVTGIMKKDKK